MSELHVPQHVGIIMDGNRRWAKQRGKPAMFGHAAGQKTLITTINAAFNRGVKFLTVYAFSTENWSRAQEETSYLMNAVSRAVQKHTQQFVDGGVKVLFVGDLSVTPKSVQRAAAKMESMTSAGTKGVFSVCFNYGGQQELVDAAKRMITDGVTAELITPELVNEYLYQPEVPPMDLVIRTSGEQRLSGFMLWRAAYSEFIFRDEYWPDFSPEIFDECLVEYSKRQRRFGG